MFAVKPQSNKKYYHVSEQCGTFFSYWDRSHFSKQCGTFFSYWERLLNTFNYCMQWNLYPTKKSSQFNEKCDNFYSYGDRTHFSEECGTFSVMETDYSTHLITVALWYPFTLYIVWISFPSVQLYTKMNETG